MFIVKHLYGGLQKNGAMSEKDRESIGIKLIKLEFND